MNKHHVSRQVVITACTRERPVMLEALIKSYTKLKIPLGYSVRLEIIENDTFPRCQDLVNNHPTTTTHPIGYHHEPNLGIPFARNRCIKVASELQADVLAFVDDDEQFTEDWLSEMCTISEAYNWTAIIQGQVIPTFPQKTPDFIKGFYQPPQKKDYASLTTCATNNVFVPIQTILSSQTTFDESTPFSQGEDVKFFRQLHRQGVPMIFYSKAIVFEEIPKDRASIKWLSMRYFRIGTSIAQKSTETDSKLTPHRAISSVPIILLRALKIPFQIATNNPEKALKNWLKICNKTGQVLASYGFQDKSYKKVDGH